MAYRKRKPKLPPGTWVERRLMRSKAFLSLKGFAPQLLILFLAKRDRQTFLDGDGVKIKAWVNLDNLQLTYKELEGLGITKPRISRGLDELLAKGFLEIRHAGGGYKRDCSIYALTDKWTFWTPGAVFSQREKDAKRGYQRTRKKPKVIHISPKLRN